MNIKTSRQLKDKINNITGGNSTKSQTLLRKYMMEHFLARIAESKYKNNFILKGGMLVSAIVGEESRTTVDIDTTVFALPLNKKDTERIIKEVAEIDLGDGIFFEIKSTLEIMEDKDYSGIRINLLANFEGTKQPIKIDISTDDEITPSAIEYSYNLMFEQGTIRILSYNLETLFAEKLQTIIYRSTANTRMRDFYDVHVLWEDKHTDIDFDVLRDAFINTSKKRETLSRLKTAQAELIEIADSKDMQRLWKNYCKENDYVGDLSWNEVVKTAEEIIITHILDEQDVGLDMQL